MLFTCRKENLHAHVNLLFFPVQASKYVLKSSVL